MTAEGVGRVGAGPTPFVLPCAGGDVAGLDHGGAGPVVLLLHDRLENAARWAAVGPELARFARPIALDAPGHGASPAAPGCTGPQRWRRLAEAVDLLGLGRPLVVGQGLGGWDATAAVAAGVLDARGLVLLEAVFPASARASAAYLRQFDDDALVASLVARFGLGRRVPTWARVEAAVADVLAAARGDWLLRDQDPDVLAAEVRRAFVPDGAGWRRTPDAATARRAFAVPEHAPAPGVEVYDGLGVPVDLVVASDGIVADDADAVRRLVAGRTDRTLRTVTSTHDVAGTAPGVVVDVIRCRLDALGRAGAGQRGR